MTEPEWATLAEYVRWVANEMELRDWTINVLYRPCENDAYATIYPTFGRKVADIHFHEDFRGYSADVQRHTVVHELVHLHVEAAGNMVRRDLETLLGQGADLIFWNGFKRQLEYGVDGIAMAIAKHMPHIAWPE